VDGVEYEAARASDYSSGGVTSHSYSITVPLNASGGAVVSLAVDSTANDEQAQIDNFVISQSQPTNQIVDSFTYTVTDPGGNPFSSTLDVTIHDDAPVATPLAVNLQVEPVTTNLAVIVDVSSSMSNQDLALTEQAIESLINNYEGMGGVNVSIVQFYGNGNIQSGWIDAAAGKALTLDTTRSGTDIEQGLRAMVENAYSGNQPVADQDIMYFFGDGDTYDAYQTDFEAYTGITDPASNPWGDFITSGAIDKLFSYSVNTSSVLSDIAHLADNGENVVSQDAINISNVADLTAAVNSTAGLYTEGNLTQDASGSAIIEFGADGGHIEAVTIGANTVNYDAANPVQTVTGAHGDFEINFDTGAYRYMPTDRIVTTETIQASVTDGDGDLLNTILLDINISYSSAFNDTFTYDPTAPTAVDGDAGFDTLIVADDAPLDFSGVTHSNNIDNMERLDLTSGDHAITNLSINDVIDITDGNNQLEILGENSDSVALSSSEWQATGNTVNQNGHQFTEYQDSGSTVTLLIEDTVSVTII
ncbi:MAG: VWA domain-containing protein, partial [Sedimenticola sp.]|nr:VWA domain-containing protein [Sedimenticola sp.]